jgi:hypothetical protein
MAVTYRDPVDWSVRVVASDKPHQKNRSDRFPGGPTTDIKAWLTDNDPRDYAELKALRKALYSRQSYGNFVITQHSNTWADEQRFTVAGRNSSLLIVSDKSRHFLLGTLCRIAKGL